MDISIAFPRARRGWAWLLGAPLAAYVLAGCSLYGIQRSLVFHPWPGVPEQAEAAGMVPVKVTAADGVTVVHWYASAQPGHATVVLFHGNGGTVSALASWAKAFRARGFGVVLADYRGYSGNPGAPSEEGLYADARAILDWVAAQGIDERYTVLLGWSLGTGIAVQMAVEREAAALVLLAPYTSVVDVGARRYPLFPVSLLMRDRFDSRSKIAAVHTPVMIVTGERDRVVPADMGHELYAAANEPKRALFLPETGHLIVPSAAFAAVSDFLAQRSSIAAARPSQSRRPSRVPAAWLSTHGFRGQNGRVGDPGAALSEEETKHHGRSHAAQRHLPGAVPSHRRRPDARHPPRPRARRMARPAGL